MARSSIFTSLRTLLQIIATGLSSWGAVMDVTERKAAFAALEISEQRYRRLFDHTPISLWRFDNSDLVKRLNELKNAGVVDLSAYMDAHPEFLWEAAEMLQAREANGAAVRMFGAKDTRELLSTCTRYWQARPDTLRRMLESGFRGERAYEEKTQVKLTR